jgi:hypothetical protein
LTAEGLAHAVRILDNSVALMCARGSTVQLMMTLAVPDDVVFGVFAAGSEQVVARVCAQAGIPARRLSLAFDARATHQPWANT